MINNSFLNILFFIITTILYFVAIRPKLTVEVMMNPDAQVKYEKQKLVSLGIYFLLAVLVQFVINVSVIRSACGGNLSQNIGSSALITFLNWVLIFGVMMVILVAFPGFKSAFSDVVGYFYVSKKANELLTDLLIDPKLSGKIDAATQGNPDKKRELEAAADTIIKICNMHKKEYKIKKPLKIFCILSGQRTGSTMIIDVIQKTSKKIMGLSEIFYHYNNLL